MNETAERINGLCSYDRCYCRHGCICSHRTDYSWYLVNDMLLIAASMLGGFIFAALLSDDVDDDDGPDGGMMIPAYSPPSS